MRDTYVIGEFVRIDPMATGLGPIGRLVEVDISRVGDRRYVVSLPSIAPEVGTIRHTLYYYELAKVVE